MGYLDNRIQEPTENCIGQNFFAVRVLRHWHLLDSGIRGISAAELDVEATGDVHLRTKEAEGFSIICAAACSCTALNTDRKDTHPARVRESITCHIKYAHHPSIA